MKKVLLLVFSFVVSNIIAQSPVPNRHFRESGGVLKEVIINTTPTRTGSSATLITDRKNQPSKAVSLNGDYYQSSITANAMYYTISFFVKTTTSDTQVRSIVDMYNDHGCHFYLGNGKIYAEARYKYSTNGGSSYIPFSFLYCNGNTVVNDGNWHNVILRFSRRSVSGLDYVFYELFVDGNLDASANQYVNTPYVFGVLPTTSFGSNLTFTLGAKNSNLSGAHYQDGIDDVKYFNSALTDTQITLVSKDREVPEKFYVNPLATGTNDGKSWANAFTSIQSAFDIAILNDDEIWVAKGNYTPHASDRTKSFTPKAEIKIYGGFAGTETQLSQRDQSLLFTTNATVFNGDLSGNDNAFINFNNTTRNENSYNVVTINKNNCTIDGLVIKNGYADGTVANTTYGAGIFKTESVTNLTITNCKIADNVSYYGAGAYLVTNDNSTIVIDRCVFENNLTSYGASGFYCFLNTTAVRTLNFNVTNTVFNSNKTANDAVKNRNAVGASAGWIRAYNDNTTINFKLINNTFVNNISEGTGTGTTFPTFAISQNSSSVMTAVTSNNIFYNNKRNGNVTAITFDKMNDVSLGYVTVYNSMDENNFSTISSGNKFNIISGNPLLNNDFTLQTNSPAIDSGDNSKIPAGILYDLFGNTRIQGSIVDLGAIEGAYALSNSTFEKSSAFKAYPNPVKEILFIENSLNKSIDKVSILDVTGKMVLEQLNNIESISLSSLKQGFYIVLITSEGIITSQKIIKE